MKTILKLVALTFFASSFIFLTTPKAVGAEEKIPAEVYQELENSNDGYLYVIVLLEPVPLLPRERMAEQQDAVRQIQERVLARMSLGNFNPAYLYKNFAAMTGLVNAEGLGFFETDPEVLSVGLDASCIGHLNDSVPFIEADQVQNSGITGQGVTVAVLDTGIDTDHPDLSDNIAAGAWHSLDQGADQGPGAEDDNGHGTNVSGIITSAGAVSSVGVAPDADVLAVKVLEADGSGWLSDWVAGVDYVVSVINDYDNLCAINMSLGTSDLYSDCPCDNSTTNNQLAQASILAAQNVGIVTFASSGNDGSTTSMSSPACLSSAAAVAAVYDQDLGREPNSGTYQDLYGSDFSDCFDDPTYGDLITCFSNRSGCNDLAAPGRSITAPGLGGGTSNYTGTSQASPHCTGVAALMCQRADDLSMILSPNDILQALRDTGHPTDDPAGTTPNPIRIDAFDAVGTLNQAPEAICSDFSDNSDENCCITVSVSDIDGGSFDPDGADDIDTICIVGVDGSSVDCQEAVQICGVGLHDVTLEITDIFGLSDMCDATVEVIDGTPPDILVELNRYVLWPPNHKMVEIEAVWDVEDNCDGDPTVVIWDITSNEVDNDGGDGDFPHDIQVPCGPFPGTFPCETDVFWLRSERSGGGVGRVYTITFRATDFSGNYTDVNLEVMVPHDRSGHALCSNGFNTTGTDFIPQEDSFGMVIPTVPEGPDVLPDEVFDAHLVDPTDTYVGNSSGAIRPSETWYSDIDGDGSDDLVLIYSVIRTIEIVGQSDEIDGPVGLHYRIDDQTNFLVPNIFDLGPPVLLVGSPSGIGDQIDSNQAGVPPKQTGLVVFPNPFNPTTTIIMNLAKEQMVKLTIYDIQGSLVRSLARESLPPGRYELIWNGRDDQGRSVGSGVYMLLFVAGDHLFREKLVILK